MNTGIGPISYAINASNEIHNWKLIIIKPTLSSMYGKKESKMTMCTTSISSNHKIHNRNQLVKPNNWNVSMT